MSIKTVWARFRAFRFYHLILFLLAFSLLCGAEFLFSNRLRFETAGYTYAELDLSEATLRDGAKIGKDGLIVKDGATVLYPNAGEEVINVAVSLQSEKLQAIKMTVSTTDDANKESYRTYVDGYAYTDQTNYFRLRSSGKVRYLRLQFHGGEDVCVSAISLNETPPVQFNFLRVALIFLVIIAFWAIFKLRLWTRIYDRKNYKHKFALYVILLLCIAAFCFGGLGTAGLYRLPLKEDVTLNAYEQLFFALQKGQVELEIDHDKELYQSLENPYDYTERKEALEAQGLSVFGDTWDRAYYNGEFYCYFGIAPVILFFFPIYFLTGFMPNTPLVVLLVSIIGALALFGALTKILEYFRVRIPLIILCIGYPVLLMGSLLPMIAVSADMYYLAVASGIAFIMLSIYFGFSALCCKTIWMRRSLFALCGVSLAITLASRPTVILYAAVLIPPYIGVLCEKGRSIIQKLLDALSFLIPLLICIVPVLWYNYIRFDSLFEFGATYQLTFSDISYNRLSFAMLGETLMHYFLQPPQLSGLFPYLRPSYLGLNTYGTYFYSVSSVGAFSFVLTGFGFAQGFVTKKQPIKKAVYLLLLLLPFAVAFVNTCLGGVNIRYLADILFPLIFLGLLVMIELMGKANETFAERTSLRVFCLFAAVLFLTLCLSLALVFANERDNIYLYNPFVFRAVASMFS